MVPDELFDYTIRHQVLLERLKAGQVADIRKTVAKAEKELIRILQKLDVAKVGDLPVRTFNKLLKDLRRVESIALEKSVERFSEDLSKLAGVEAELEAKSISRLIQNRVAIPKADAAFAFAQKNPISATGELLDSFVKSTTPNQLRKTEALMRRAYAEGMTVQEAVRGLRGTKARNYKDGISALKTRQAEAVVRTSIQHTANAARLKTWTDNADIVEGYQWLSTLDSKTTRQCQALDKRKFKLGEGPTPPIHINCRSTTIPDLNDGLDFLDEGATRSGQFGPVDADTSYFEWLKSQKRGFIEETLGPERASLFLDTGVTAERFQQLSLDKFFQPLDNDELRDALEKALN